MALADDYDLIVFDFDGTLCDSAEVKTDAFYLLYLDDEGPEFAERVRTYHVANAGVSRFDKIRHIEGEMLGRAADEARVEAVARRFGDIVEAQVMAAPLFDGVVDVLDDLDGAVTLAVASATPTEELRRIVLGKGLDRYFAAVEGSPRTKGDILVDLIERFGVEPRRTLMVGDQPSDRAAADQAGSSFLSFGRSDTAAPSFRSWRSFVAR